VLVLFELAQVCYWSAKGLGTNLDRELERIFRTGATRDDVRGQLANLILAGHALSWNQRVEFLAEQKTDTTPDWCIRSDRQTLWVECTSYGRTAQDTNDLEHIRKGIVAAWEGKHSKFSSACSPGVISTDLSPVPVTREFGAFLLPQHLLCLEIHLSCGHRHCFRVYNSREDTEHMCHESRDRRLLGVLASALRSRQAKERGIKGFLAYQGQQILVDTVKGRLMRPKRGILAWAGDIEEPELGIAATLTDVPWGAPGVVSSPMVPRVFLV